MPHYFFLVIAAHNFFSVSGCCDLLTAITIVLSGSLKLVINSVKSSLNLMGARVPMTKSNFHVRLAMGAETCS